MMNNECKYYALEMDEYSGDDSSLSCFNTTDYTPMPKCLGLISVGNGYVRLNDVGFKDLAELKQVYPDTIISNELQFSNHHGKAKGMKQYYVLSIDSNDRFENGGINAEADDEDAMFCVLELCDNWAEVLDWGYSSMEQLLFAWNTVEFQKCQ